MSFHSNHLPPMPDTYQPATMSKEELSLLLFLETRAVDNGGLVATPHMNAADFDIIERWKQIGFIKFGRLTRESINNLRGSTHWVELSDDAWRLAHEERRARYARIHAKRAWQTTDEKRANHDAAPITEEA